MMKKTLFVASIGALLAGTTLASAQVYDDPPGWQFQRRGILDMEGRNPNLYDRYPGGYGSYGYSPYQGYVVVPGPRYYRRDSPPGSRFQNRGIDEDLGRNPLNWRWR